MSFEKDCQVKCPMEFCSYGAATEDTAMAVGWGRINDQLYCPLHYGPVARSAKLLEDLRRLQLRVEELRRARNNRIAKEELTRADYRAWDQFQSDLADYHKKTGKLAPKQLRNLDPQTWWEYYRKRGRIDVEIEVANLEASERKANETREWLARRNLG